MPLMIEPYPYNHSLTFPDIRFDFSHPPALIHHYGFDKEAKYKLLPRQMRCQFTVTAGSAAGLHFELSDPTICDIVSQDMSLKLSGSMTGLVTLEGKRVGTCDLLLKNATGGIVDRTAIEVAEFRNVKIRFYNHSDGIQSSVKDPGSNPAFTQSALRDLVFEVNNIVSLQCGVTLELIGQSLRDVATTQSVGSRKDLPRDLHAFMASTDIDRNAEYHVVFVAALDKGVNGTTSVGLTLMKADAGASRPLTLAHEFVHFVCGGGQGHDDKTSDLMFKTAPHGIEMRKERLKKAIFVRPTLPAPGP